MTVPIPQYKKSYCSLVLLLVALVSCQNKSPGNASAGQPAGGAVQPTVGNGPPAPPPPAYNLAAGTELHIRLNETLDTGRNRRGDAFTATLGAPVMDGDRVAIPKGTQFTGHVSGAKPSGRLRRRAHLTITLDSFKLNGQTYRVKTSSTTRVSGNHRKRNLTLIGGGGGAGAAIGALAGGGAGAAIGAATGAGAGTAGAALTGQKQAAIRAESVVKFTLKAPVQIQG